MLPLLGSFIPIEILEKMMMSNFLWRPFGFTDIAGWFGIPIPKDCTHTFQYESHSQVHYDCFLINFFQAVFPLSIFLIIALGLFLIKKKYNESSHWMITYVLTLNVFMGIIIRYFIETYTYLFHSSIASLASLSVKDGYNIASLLLNLLYLQVAAFTIYVFFRYLTSNYSIGCRYISGKVHITRNMIRQQSTTKS